MNRTTCLSILGVVTLAGFLSSCRDDVAVPVNATSNTSSLERTLVPIQGYGTGWVSVEPLNGTAGVSATISVTVTGVMSNSSFYLEQSPELGRPLSDDGVGERAAGLWPWQQPSSPGFAAAQAFVALPAANPDSLVTDSQGNGNGKFAFDDPKIPAGSHFDVVFRIVKKGNWPGVSDTTSGLTTELRTDCFAFPGK